MAADELKQMNPNLVPLDAVLTTVRLHLAALSKLRAHYNTVRDRLERLVTKVAVRQFAEV